MFKNTIWLFSANLLRLFGGFIVGIWLARYLGAEDFGLLNYGLSLFIIFDSLASFGMKGVLTKEFVNFNHRHNEIFTISFVIRIVTSLFIVLLGAGFLAYLNDFKYLIAFIILLKLLFNPFKVLESYYEALVKSKFYAIALIVSYSLRLLATITAINLNMDILIFAYILVLEDVILVIILAYYFIIQGGRFKRLRKAFTISLARKLMNQSYPLIISSLGATLYLKIDQVMVVELVNEAEGGIYAAASRFSSIFNFIPVVIISSIFPLIIRYKKENSYSYKELLKRLNAFFFIVSGLMALFISLFSKNIILITYGQNYLSAAGIISIHIWTIFFVFSQQILSKWLIVEELTQISMLRHLLGLVVNLVLNFILIPSYGGLGAATASLVSFFISTVGFSFFVSKTREYSYLYLQSFKFVGIKSIIYVFNLFMRDDR